MSQGQLMLSHFIIQILIVGIYNSKLLQLHFFLTGEKKDVSFYRTKQVTVSSKGSMLNDWIAIILKGLSSLLPNILQMQHVWK